jgi:hypothetical protein
MLPSGPSASLGFQDAMGLSGPILGPWRSFAGPIKHLVRSGLILAPPSFGSYLQPAGLKVPIATRRCGVPLRVGGL